MSAYSHLYDEAGRACDAARYPNRAGLVDALRRGRTPSTRERRNEKNALFNEFANYFDAFAQAFMNAGAAQSEFHEFGFGDVASFYDSLPDLFSSELWLAAPNENADALLVLPAETALTFVLEGLGYDLGALCANKTLTRDLFEGDSTSLTELEVELLARAGRRLIALVPNWSRGGAESVGAEPWKLRRFSESGKRTSLVDFTWGYWETRSIRLNGRAFGWTTLWNAETTFGASLERPTFRRRETEVQSPDAVETSGARKGGDPESDSAFVEVVIARGEIPADFVSALKPGDVLTTEVPADRLFDVYIDGRLSYRGRPGVYRQETAVRLAELAEGEG